MKSGDTANDNPPQNAGGGASGSFGTKGQNGGGTNGQTGGMAGDPIPFVALQAGCPGQTVCAPEDSDFDAFGQDTQTDQQCDCA